MVPGPGIEPGWIAPTVFETVASTDSAIRADFVKIDCKCNHIFPFGKKSGQKITDKPHIILNMRIYAFSAYHFHRTAKAPANNRFGIGLRNCPKSQLPHKTPNKHPVPLPHQP